MTFEQIGLGLLIAGPALLGLNAAYKQVRSSSAPNEALELYRNAVIRVALASWLRSTSIAALVGSLLGGLFIGPYGFIGAGFYAVNAGLIVGLPATLIGALVAKSYARLPSSPTKEEE